MTNINKVDFLILEGTNIGRTNSLILSEKELEDKLFQLLKTEKLNIIVFSAQNLDRFISIYKSCLRLKKTIVIDPYTAYMLEKFQSLSKNIPQYNWNNIKIYFSPNKITEKLAKTGVLYKYKSQKISKEEILNNPQKYIVKDNRVISQYILKNMDIEELQIIYSLWSGYLDKLNNYWNEHRDNIIQLHSSGHADIKFLKQFVKEVNPTKIIPIHTACPNLYLELFGDKAISIEDGNTIDLKKNLL